MYYVSIKKKFTISIISVILWTIICTLIEQNWWHDLSNRFGSFIACLIVFVLAFLPGIMISLTIMGIILDRTKRRPICEDLKDITVLIAAYNEEESIYGTIQSIANQQYPKKIIVKAIDNNSHDNTKNEIYRAINDFPELDVQYVFESKQGKFAALNKGLFETDTEYVITLDADTYLHDDALLSIANSMTYENKNKRVGAIAGSIFVKNSGVNLLTKMQYWEYFLSLSGIKRFQGLFQSILVAQGAFSIYNTKLLQEIGGWKDSIGEDIVLTWEILSQGYTTQYADRAIGFTNAPTELKIFTRQRARWARGMIEGFRHFSFKNCKSLYSKVLIFTDLFLFAIDFGVSFLYTPGLIAALFLHDFIIVGPTTLLLMPLTLALFAVMFWSEYYRVFKPLGIKVEKYWFGLLSYILSYSIILSPTCIKGYIQEFTGTKRRWK